jgi:hypothetical protein
MGWASDQDQVICGISCRPSEAASMNSLRPSLGQESLQWISFRFIPHPQTPQAPGAQQTIQQPKLCTRLADHCGKCGKDGKHKHGEKKDGEEEKKEGTSIIDKINQMTHH